MRKIMVGACIMALLAWASAAGAQTPVVSVGVDRGPVSFGATVTESAAALPSYIVTTGITCTAASGNSASIFFGGSAVNTTFGTGGTGYPVSPGASIAYSVKNSNQVYIISASSTSDTVNCTGN